MIRQSRQSAVLVAVALGLTWIGVGGCQLLGGDDGSGEDPVSVPAENEDAGDTGGEDTIIFLDVLPTYDSGPACGPVGAETRGYYKVEGDPAKRPTCREVCDAVCLSCDGNYQSAIGAGLAHRARYGPDGSVEDESGKCGERPSAEKNDPLSGNTFQLESYTCFCRTSEAG